MSSGLGFVICDECLSLVPETDHAAHRIRCGVRWNCPDCGKSIPLAERDTHIETHFQVRCDACGDVIGDGLAEHEKSCVMRLVACAWCQDSIPFLEHQTHASTCECRKVPCEKCNASIMVSQMKRHLSSRCQFPNPTVPPPIPKAIADINRNTEDTNASIESDLENNTTEETVISNTANNENLPVNENIFSLTSVEESLVEIPVKENISSKSSRPLSGRNRRPSSGRKASMLKCDLCNTLVIADIFEDHQQVCSVLKASESGARPFSRGAPLPSVGVRQDVNKKHKQPTTRKVPRPPAGKRNQMPDSPRTSKHQALFGSFTVPTDAPVISKKKVASTTYYQESRAPRPSKSKANLQGNRAKQDQSLVLLATKVAPSK